MTIFRCNWLAAGTALLAFQTMPTHAQVPAEPNQKQNFSAGELGDMCAAAGDSEQAAAANLICIGYIGGVMDTLTTAVTLDGVKPIFCLPDEARRDQPINAFAAHMARHPEKRTMVAASVVRVVLADTFPCSGKDKK